MLRCRLVAAGIAGLVLFVLASSRSADEEVSADEALLRECHVGTDGPALLAFFRERSLSEADRQHLADLVRQLGSDDFAQREKASAALVARGPLAVPFLRPATESADAEVVRRARACLEEIDRGPGPALPAAAVRLLVRRKPAGAVEALLRFAPYADDGAVEYEIVAAVVALGLHDSKADTVLLEALRDKEPARRAVAVAAVGRASDAGQRAAARRLLNDPDAAVRYRAAVAAVASRDRDGLVALVELLANASTEWADRAEIVLFQLAGEQAPEIKGEEKRQTAWQRWLREQGDKVDLARLEMEPPFLGYTIAVEPEIGTLWECDRAGKVLWKINGLARPHYAQRLPNGHVLVCEYDGKRVTERDAGGAILWSHTVTDPRYVERLSNGNIFIAATGSAFEVTRAGKEVWTLPFDPGAVHLGVQRKPNGNVVSLSIPGHLREATRGGRTVRSFDFPRGHWCGVQALPDNHYLAADLQVGRIVEVDATGKIVWECRVEGACFAIRRPDGRTLVSQFGGKRLVAVDRGGTIVWEKAASPGSNVYCAGAR
jgi:hypothetical protein